jgi:PAS domain-containing protein
MAIPSPTTTPELTACDLAEETLRRLLNTHQLILDAAGKRIYGLDCKDKMTSVNAAATAILGW